MISETKAQTLLDVPRETIARLEQLADLLREENQRQNLVSEGSLAEIWSRHFLDSAQLVRFAPQHAQTWLDLGSGAGFPGLIVALVGPFSVTLVESRRLRAEFLRRAVALLGLGDRVEILCARAETIEARAFDVISARAFAPLERLLPLAGRFSSLGTVWILPKGRSAESELAAVRSSWQGEFRLEPSLTDPDARIIVASGVRMKGKKHR
ncbi:MAG: 16S rRNA (guanine(527)-N(7))-methyltransferase RsmG [Allosphingosinicella sp.]